MKDVLIWKGREEYVPNTERRGRLAAMKDVPIMYRMEEFARGMVQTERSTLAAMKNVTIMPRKEEFVLGTVQKLRHAVTKDVPNTQGKEECVGAMEQSEPVHLAAMMDVPA